ncbi:MAG: hypothetical protein J5927_02980 [Oscillospiraceae bacterium]|nr:hypothetical protein [Oscillospiraceae bacterium]
MSEEIKKEEQHRELSQEEGEKVAGGGEGLRCPKCGSTNCFFTIGGGFVRCFDCGYHEDRPSVILPPNVKCKNCHKIQKPATICIYCGADLTL